jgi:hypothetical protein
MTEGLFVLTTLLVAYVIYVIVNEKKTEAGAAKKPATVAAPSVSGVAVAEKPKVAAVKPKPAAAKAVTAKPVVAVTPKPAAAKKAAPAAVVTAAPAAPASIKGTGLKDPKTGEVATTYSNYRFTKRWIKDALVAEKLVDKVYKNDEINADVEAKIKVGIAKLEGMKKYKP